MDQALAEAEKHGAKRIGRIRLLLGEGGGLVPDCVRFYFDQMKTGTAAADAELEFKRVPLRIRCPKCGKEWGLPQDGNSTEGFAGMCSCNSGGDVVSGQELVIESIDVD